MGSSRTVAGGHGDREWPAGSDALAHIVAGSSTHLDPTIVDVLMEVAYTDLGVRMPSEGGDATVAVAAAERCPELDSVQPARR